MRYKAVRTDILADRCYAVGDAASKRVMAREPLSAPRSQDKEVLATIGRRGNSMPASQYWDTYTKLSPGYFYSSDLLQVKADGLREGICPQVLLSGTGVIK